MKKQIKNEPFFPIANISRIIRNNLPEEVKLSYESMKTIQMCTYEFICFITSEASDICLEDKRKIINGNDLINSLDTLGFEHYNKILVNYLEKYKLVFDAIKKKKESSKNTKGNSSEASIEHEKLSNNIEEEFNTIYEDTIYNLDQNKQSYNDLEVFEKLLDKNN